MGKYSHDSQKPGGGGKPYADILAIFGFDPTGETPSWGTGENSMST